MYSSRKQGGQANTSQQQREKSHAVTRLPEGPYVFPVQAPTNPYNGRPQPQVPSLFGGNVDRGHTNASTLAKEVSEESQHQYALVQGTVQHQGSQQGRGYMQQLNTAVVQPAQPPQQASVSHSSSEHRETSGFFMPTLAQLNASGPLTTGNVNQVVSDLFLQHAQQQHFNTQPQDVSDRMQWHTLQFAQQQMVSDSQLYQRAQTTFQQARDGLMPPPVLPPRASPYAHSVVDEAFNAMPPHPQPQPQQAQGRAFYNMEVESEAEFNGQRREAGTHGFGNL